MEIIISLIVTLVIFGLIMWGLQQLPMPAGIKQVVYVLCILVLILFLLGFIGYGPMHGWNYRR